MPTDKLAQFFLLKELNLIKIRAHGLGHLWLCEKKRVGGEACPKCSKLSTSRYGVAWSVVRDETLRNVPITLKIKKHRYYCKSCKKPFTESVPGILPKRRSTQRLRKQILKDSQDFTNLARVARRHHCSRSFVHRLFYTQMEIKLRERKTSRWPQILGIDEHFFSRSKGYTEFTTVFTNIGRRRMFEMAETKNNTFIKSQLSHIEGRHDVEVVVMDLARGYRALAEDLFPNAKIVADKFHVLRLLNPSIIKARKEIHGHKQELHLRRKLLTNRQKLDYFQRSDLQKYLMKHPKLAELYHYKERLHALYRTKGYRRASLVLDKLLAQMKGSSLEEIQRLQKTLSTWKDQVLEYFRHRYTNAFTESMNAIAKLVQRRGCGYKNFKNYRLRTLNACPL